jgi:hypothetical protein
MTEQQKTIERLSTRTGYDVEEVEHLLTFVGYTEEDVLLQGQDRDLWIVEPNARFVSTDPEEEVAEWEDAVDKLQVLAEVSCGGGTLFGYNVAVGVCLDDASARAQEALRRAKQRVRQAREE